ncbi:Crp/Fnr family transcriptional regulator [Methylogaea oryzae]|uniref:Crp/Fnr family transcriptional regulator n=1 Tax=Methylogaea oryzae TaxID=1295382 RepID=UPI0006CFB370|nr:cyclic nucleotide-binding domain-containing protein [Methylogaea oryzae]
MLEQLHRQKFSVGTVIFQEGDEGDCAYLIEEGRVEVCIAVDGEEQRVSLLGQGELIGEVALVDRQPRTATVRAVETAVLVPIRRDLVDELLEKTDPVIRHLLRVVLERFRTTQSGLSCARETAATPCWNTRARWITCMPRPPASWRWRKTSPTR